MLHHLTNEILRQLGKLVYVFAGVATVGDAEAKVEVKVLQEAFPEVVPLYHSEAVHRPVAHSELHSGTYGAQSQEGRCELIANKTPGTGVSIYILLIILFSVAVWGFGNLKQHRARLQVPDLEAREIDVVHVVLWFTQVISSDNP